MSVVASGFEAGLRRGRSPEAMDFSMQGNSYAQVTGVSIGTLLICRDRDSGPASTTLP
jgi:hypothetical protein